MNTALSVPVGGHTSPGFEPIADVFGRLVAFQGRGGAALSVYMDGVCVVDLVAGDYPRDGLQLVFSVSKLITSIAVHRAASEGRLDLDEPLSDEWPALRRESTRRITMRDVLAHRSGIAGIDGPFDLEELWQGRETIAVSAQEPQWAAGEGHGYHAFTFGSLVRGAVEQKLGVSVGDLVRNYLTQPLGLRLFLGDLPDEAYVKTVPVQFSRPAVVQSQGQTSRIAQPGSTATGTDAILAALLEDPSVFNSKRFLAAQVPSMNSVTDAHSLARLLAATIGEVDGVRVLPAAQLADMVTSRSQGLDRTLGVESHFGSGVQLPFPQLPWISAASFGHEGAGGSAAFADPNYGVAVGYTTDLFPPTAGASPVFLALLPTIRLLAEEAQR